MVTLTLHAAWQMRAAIIRAEHVAMRAEWGDAYPGAAAMTAAVLGISTEEVARVIAGAEQHTQSPE